MDPNAALKDLRDAVTGFYLSADSNDDGGPIDGGEIAEKFEALDEWLSKGGFAPAAWGGPTGTVDPAREVPADEIKALVTIEATERLINRARQALIVDESVEWAGILLEQAAEITTARTATAVKSLGLSDQISVKADDLVAPAVAKAREVQRQVRQQRWAAEDAARSETEG